MTKNKVNFETIIFLITTSLLLNCFCGYIAYITNLESGVFYSYDGYQINSAYQDSNGILKGIVILIVLSVISLLFFILMKRKTIINDVSFNIPFDAKIVLFIAAFGIFISYIYTNIRGHALSNSILSFLARVGNENFINSFLISLMAIIALYMSIFIFKDLIRSFKNRRLIVEEFALYKIFNSTKTIFKRNRLMNFIIKGATLYLIVRVTISLISLIFSGNIYMVFEFALFDMIVLFIVLAPMGIIMLRNTWYLYNKSKSLLLGTKYNKKIKSLYVAETFNNLDGLKLSLDRAYKENAKEENFKSQLITNISHDVRTPLTSIINYVDILRNKDVTEEEKKDYADRINKNSLRLKALIDTLNTAEYKVELKEIDLNDLIVREIDNYSAKLKENNLTLRTKLIEGTIILGDEKGCHRIIQNIFTNIIKYAMEGTRVYLEMIEDFDKIVVSVKNVSKYPLDITGEEALQRFTRGDKSRNTEGAGLGLSIVKSLIDSQNGEVKVDIDGDLFKITLEFEKGKR
ncbi:putative membrane protein [Clostridium bornimense]|uniref:histidine kinase n=1 Tax=Clostridium bornimense TaxID=1216932 RepID=W6S065_9CLOT|nr:HAMP domain-containing sensor histidine kinase [Clostridium bornimense]CDM67667.1 putative membrane protein [Clostridium bornimense]